MINAPPGSGLLTGTGAVDLMPGSTLSHHDKWVTAKLALRLPKSLAGAACASTYGRPTATGTGISSPTPA